MCGMYTYISINVSCDFKQPKKSSKVMIKCPVRIPQNEDNTLNELICDNLFAVKLYSLAWNYHLVMTNPCWKDDLLLLGKQPLPLVGLSYLKFQTGLFWEKV